MTEAHEIESFHALKRIHESVNNRVLHLEKQLGDAKQIIAILEAEKKQWYSQKLLQDKIIHQQLESKDNEVRRLQDEIGELQNQLRG